MAIAEQGELRSAGRIETAPERLELFVRSLDRRDRVALEVTGNAWEIARIIEPHVARVLVVSPADTAIRQARAKTDRLDARALARLLAAGSLDGLWLPDERTRTLRRRLGRRAQVVRARTRAKNEVHAALIRRPMHAFYERIRTRRRTRSRSLPRHASWQCCSGTCSPRRRTTPTPSRR